MKNELLQLIINEDQNSNFVIQLKNPDWYVQFRYFFIALVYCGTPFGKHWYKLWPNVIIKNILISS